jgi:hypothetical protein
MAEELKEVLIINNAQVIGEDNKTLCYSCLGYSGLFALCAIATVIAYFFWK